LQPESLLAASLPCLAQISLPEPIRQIGPAAIRVPEPGTVCQCSLSPPTTDRLRD